MRWCFRCLCAISLALFLAATWIGARSYGVQRRLAWEFHGKYYVLNLEHGRLTLIGPPPPGNLNEDAAAEQAVSQIRNSDVEWTYVLVEKPRANSGRSPPGDQFAGGFVTTYSWTHENLWPIMNRPHLHLTGQVTAIDRALIKAMNDPERFVVAHVVLMYPSWPWKDERNVSPWQSPKSVVSGDWNGLKVELLPAGAVEATGRWGEIPYFYVQAGSWRVDPLQRDALRNRWYEQLGSKLGPAGLVPDALNSPSPSPPRILRTLQLRSSRNAESLSRMRPRPVPRCQPSRALSSSKKVITRRWHLTTLQC
jgi:hypothetical protein